MAVDLISRDEILELMEKNSDVCVSIFMPTHRVSAEMEQDKRRFKNLVRKAEEELRAQGVRNPDAIIKQAVSLESDNNFWNYQEDGLAFFLSKDFFKYYRLPIHFNEMVTVNNRFYIKPLIPMLSEDGKYYVLALSQNEIRLLECTRHSVKELELEGIPSCKEEANKLIETDKGFNYRSNTTGQSDFHMNRNVKGANFHGHGTSPKDENKERIHRFFQQVDKGLHRMLMEEQAPLVLAGVEFLHPLYRETNHYPHLLEMGVYGNPQMLKGDELNGEAWPIVEPIFKKSRKLAEEKYRQLLGSEKASNDIKEVLRAAYQGRVGVLMVSTDVQQWGRYDLSKDHVELHPQRQPGDEDLLDVAAKETLRKDGTVYALRPNDIPLETNVAAVFRF